MKLKKENDELIIKNLVSDRIKLLKMYGITHTSEYKKLLRILDTEFGDKNGK